MVLGFASFPFKDGGLIKVQKLFSLNDHIDNANDIVMGALSLTR